MSDMITKLTKQMDEAESKLAEMQAKMDAMENNERKVDGSDIKGVKLYYWGLKNRGNFARMILAEAGVDYEDITDNNEIALRCKCKNSMEETEFRFDPFAPPFLYHDGHVVSQTAAIVMYLGEITGLRPKLNADNALASMIVLNISDAWVELAKTKDGTVDKLKEFLLGRFEHWLDILEAPLLHDNKVWKYYFDNRITYADISLANMLDGFHELFEQPAYDEYIGNKHKHLEALYQRVTNRKNIRQLLDKQNKEGIVWYPPFFAKPLIDNMKTLAKELRERDSVKTQKVAA